MNKNNFIMVGCMMAIAIIAILVLRHEAAETRQAIRAVGSPAPKDMEAAADQVTKLVPKATEAVDKAATSAEAMMDKMAGTLAGSDQSPSGGLPGAASKTIERVESTIERILSPQKSEDGSSEKDKGTDVVDKASDTIGGLFDRVLSGGGKSESKDKSKKSEKAGKQNDRTDKSRREAESTDSEPESKANEPVDRAEQAIDRVFDVVGKTTKAGDRTGEQWLGLSDEEERNWGQKLHQELLAQETPVKDAKLKRRIELAVAPLLSRKKREFDYKFTVLKNEDVNAFAFPGGYIYLTDSLLKFTKKEVELQFVLGHEIGHVDLRHCARRLMPLARASQVAPAAGSMAGVLHGMLGRTYAQDEEYDADEYSYKNLRALHKSTPDILAFLRRLQTYEEQQDQSAAPREEASDPLSRISSRLNDHFRTHPPTEDRVRRLESLDAK